MPAKSMPGNGLKAAWNLGESQWKDDMDANLRFLSAVVQAQFESVDGSLPDTPAEGMVIYDPPSDMIRGYLDATWVNITAPKKGWIGWDKKTGRMIIFGESGVEQAWIEEAPDDGHRYIRMSKQWLRDSYRINAFIPNIVTGAQLLSAFIIPAEMEWAPDAAGSIARCDHASTDDITLDLRKDGASIGSIFYEAASLTGTITLTPLVPGEPIVFTPGSELSIYAPASFAGVPDGLKLLFQLEM